VIGLINIVILPNLRNSAKLCSFECTL
jgi:hypothetical protein